MLTQRKDSKRKPKRNAVDSATEELDTGLRRDPSMISHYEERDRERGKKVRRSLSIKVQTLA
jgi:hypothetical protein